jgi:hypothetical protein
MVPGTQHVGKMRSMLWHVSPTSGPRERSQTGSDPTGTVARRTLLKGAFVAGASLVLPTAAWPAVGRGIGILGYDIEGPFDYVPDSSEALRRATRFDAIVAAASMYATNAAAMVDANPRLKLGCYINATHTPTDSFPEDWYCHTSTGQRTRDAGVWAANYLMNPLSGWVDRMIEILQGRLERSGYNAAYIDGAGIGALNVSTTPAIDPRTNAPWTESAWATDMVALTRRVRETLSVDVWTNGVGDADRYFDQGSAGLVPVSDRGFTEQYTRHAAWPIDRFPTLTDWQRTGAMTSQIGPKYAALTKVWVSATQSAKDRWHRYALTTFLLSARPGGLYYFTYQRASTVTPFHAYWRTARLLGAPLTSTYSTLSNGLATRSFEGGRVLCNPTSTALGWTAQRAFRGVSKGERLTVPAYDGRMLTSV